MNALRPTGNNESDYTLTGRSAWITAGRFSIYIQRITDGICIEALPIGDEAGTPIGKLCVYDADIPEQEQTP